MLAFQSRPSFVSGATEIFTVNPDGSGRSALTDAPGFNNSPSWSPDGRRIAFSRESGDFGGPAPHLVVMNSDGTGLTDVTEGIQPAWSPNGTKLAFVRLPSCFPSPGFPCPESDIWTINVDGTGLTRVTHDNGNDFAPDWSPDGAKLAFEGGGGGYDIWTVDPDGSGLSRLTDDPEADIDPSWSPDGSKIAFSSRRDQPATSGCGSTCNFEIYVMNADGSGEARLTNDPATDQQPAWSPDGEKIAFSRFNCSDSSCDGHIYAIDGNGSGAVAVTSGPAFDSAPDWQALPGPRREDYKNQAQFCKSQRDFLREATFSRRYGGGANAYGRCVSARGP
jgi:TolB protein